ncbi:hypothetical protein UFOVP189_44 [uncultured Caudovirales phage]|uniref:Uncharacterized protein n=1 Tax=uncultured Caudovirales phage TaxID=2100421 RepID=A0A6J7WFX0_9CAUD|nr:hypothetical protein UFOVP189_44 [uncultured Caudovirales phage]
MKITATFDSEEDAIQAIQSHYAWNALIEIREVLRQNTKHDLPFEQVVSKIQDEVTNALSRISLD